MMVLPHGAFSQTPDLVEKCRHGTSIVAKRCQQWINDRRLLITLSVQLCVPRRGRDALVDPDADSTETTCVILC